MKKLFFLIVICFSSFTYASQSFAPPAPPERIEALLSKVILQNTNGYFVLSDGSFWKVVGFAKRWRSPLEWWNNLQLVPPNYECVPNDWHVGAHIQICSKYGNLAIDEANASNQELLKQCTHLLTNLHTGQVLFAIALLPEQCLVKLFDEAHADGYHEGLIKGRLNSNQDAKESYNQGYSDGYKAGFREALRPYMMNPQQ